MTEDSKKSNGSAAADAAPSKTADRSRSADKSKPSKTASPSKDRATSAAGSDVPTKTPKKRRKVNHGKAIMLCTPDSVNGLADPESSL